MYFKVTLGVAYCMLLDCIKTWRLEHLGATRNSLLPVFSNLNDCINIKLLYKTAIQAGFEPVKITLTNIVKCTHDAHVRTLILLTSISVVK